jgi:hypothetical protein
MAESSKDGSFTEHLRAIHFSLVIASVALLIAATSYRERALDTAIDDIDRITGIFPVVADGQWLKREGDRLMSSRPISPPLKEYRRVDIPVSMLSARIREITKGNPLTVKLEIEESGPYTLMRGLPPDHVRVGLVPDQLKQFGDWAKMWDELQSVEICVPHIAQNQAWFISGTPASLTALPVEQWDDGKAPDFFRTQRMELKSISREVSQPLISNGSIAVISAKIQYAFVGTAVERSVPTRITMGGQDLSDLLSRQNAIPVAMVPVTCDTFDLRAQSALADKADKPWSPGSFAQTFPDLAALSDGLGALQPEQVAKVLRNLRERTGKEVEVSGLKLPLEVITRWGLIVVLAIQLYFWIDLRNFLAKAVTPGMLDVPWIGLYPDRLSHSVFWASAIVLPVFTVCFLVLKGVLGVEGWAHRLFFGALSGAGALISITLAVLTAGLIRSLSQLQINTPSRPELPVSGRVTPESGETR